MGGGPARPIYMSMDPTPLQTPAPIRWLWIAFGGLCVALAFAGVALPLLPTTPFLLLAAFAFAKSSPRLHSWLINHKRFGPMIGNWNQHGAISRPTKIVSLSFMAVMPPLSWVANAPLWIVVTQVGVLGLSGLFIVTRPSGPRS